MKDNKNKQRDTSDFEPIGGLYDDKREHGSATTQRADEGTKERDDAGNIQNSKPEDNAAGSPSRSNSTKEEPAKGHGNG